MWNPQIGSQTSAYLADWVNELFYGGERGGGKSDLQLGYQEKSALTHEGKSRGIMFRKTYAEIEELQSRAMEIFPASGAIYKTQPSAGYPFSNCWYWPNKASVKMRYIENERDYGRYHGHQYSNISFDEVTEYQSSDGLLKMLSTLRSASGVPCSVRLTGNPGGVGHGWVKDRYISVTKPYHPYVDPDSGFIRMFIPSKTSDNAILLANDPDYRSRLRAATGGNDALRKAWLEGDWDIVAGAFFDCWQRSKHVVTPFHIPDDWLRFRSGDWGSARPFSFGWWAVVGDDYHTHDGLLLPRGCLVRYKEWYGMKRNDHGQLLYNVGLKMVAEEVGRGIAMRDGGDNVSHGVLDPAAFSHDGGESIYERIFKGSGGKVIFRRADNSRVAKLGSIGGWDQVRSRLIGDTNGNPMLVIFSTCEDSIRTLPIMQHDKDRIEDIDTEQEDHCFCAGTLVETISGLIPIEQLPETGVVLSNTGYERYRSSRMVKENAKILKLTFSNGVVIKCTPDHKFKDSTDEMRYAIDLLGKEMKCNQQSLVKRYKNLMAFVITCAENTFKEKALDCIEKFGKPIKEKYPAAFMFTIKTMTSRITHYQTLNFLQSKSISAASTENNQGLTVRKEFTRQSKRRENGTEAQMVRNGIPSITMKSLGKVTQKRFPQYASIAAKNILCVLSRLSKVNIAVTTAKPVYCVSVELLKEKEDVYCITVPNTGLFVIEGGFIVANCADEIRYACMSRPYLREKTKVKKPKYWEDSSLDELWKETRKGTQRL